MSNTFSLPVNFVLLNFSFDTKMYAPKNILETKRNPTQLVRIVDQSDKQVKKELRPPDHTTTCAVRHRMIVINLSQVCPGECSTQRAVQIHLFSFIQYCVEICSRSWLLIGRTITGSQRNFEGYAIHSKHCVAPKKKLRK